MAICNEINLQSTGTFNRIAERTYALMEQVSVNLASMEMLAENDPTINEKDGTAIEDAYYNQQIANQYLKQIQALVSQR